MITELILVKFIEAIVAVIELLLNNLQSYAMLDMFILQCEEVCWKSHIKYEQDYQTRESK